MLYIALHYFNSGFQIAPLNADSNLISVCNGGKAFNRSAGRSAAKTGVFQENRANVIAANALTSSRAIDYVFFNVLWSLKSTHKGIKSLATR